jgi:hypothetical protein
MHDPKPKDLTGEEFEVLLHVINRTTSKQLVTRAIADALVAKGYAKPNGTTIESTGKYKPES